MKRVAGAKIYLSLVAPKANRDLRQVESKMNYFRQK
jgi:hypothetical protein